MPHLLTYLLVPGTYTTSADGITTPLNGNYTGCCPCSLIDAPGACPGIVHKNGVGIHNTYLPALSYSEDPDNRWKAPTGGGLTDSCCTDCTASEVSVPQMKTRSPYIGCQTMFKNVYSECSPKAGQYADMNTDPACLCPDLWDSYWGQSDLFQCGMQYNFWLRLEDIE